MISIIILAGGVGSRFGSDIPKQFVTINGKRILDITIEKFLSLRKYYELEIIVVCHPSRIETYNTYKEVKSVCGSSTRFNSFMEGFKRIDATSNRVLVHDAVRPLITQEIIIKLIIKLDECDATIPIIKPYSSTILNKDGKITNINRDLINMTQTPEAFKVDSFVRIYDTETDNSNRTSVFSLFVENQDSCTLSLIVGSQNNIKITTRDDLDLAIQLLDKQELPPIITTEWKGKWALVLGGTGGIGSAIVKRLEELDVCVVVTGSKLHLEQENALENYKKQKFDIIIHSVGTLSYNKESIIKDFTDTTFEEFKYCSDLMLSSAYQTAKLATVCMKDGGHLLFIGSSSAYKGRDQFALYATPKYALNVFVESIANELYEKYNIKTNIINPSVTDTKMTQYLGKTIKDKLPTSIVADRVIHYLSSEVYGHKHIIRIGDIKK